MERARNNNKRITVDARYKAFVKTSVRHDGSPSSTGMERGPLVREKRRDNFKMLGTVMTISNSRQYVYRAYVVCKTSIDYAN